MLVRFTLSSRAVGSRLRALADDANDKALEVGRLLVALDAAQGAYSRASRLYLDALQAESPAEISPEISPERLAEIHRVLGCVGCALCSPIQG